MKKSIFGTRYNNSENVKRAKARGYIDTKNKNFITNPVNYGDTLFLMATSAGEEQIAIKGTYGGRELITDESRAFWNFENEKNVLEAYTERVKILNAEYIPIEEIQKEMNATKHDSMRRFAKLKSLER